MQIWMRCAVAGSVVLILAWGGCSTPREQGPATATPMTKNRILDNQAGSKEVEEARRMIEAGEYNVVIPRLLQVIGRYPNSRAALDARYWMGVAYYRVSGYRDAINLFKEYLDMAPDGRFAQESAQYIAKLTEEYENRFWTPEKLQTEIAGVQEKLKVEPGSKALQLQLADLLWTRGDYNEAGRMYATLAAADAAFAANPTIRERIEFLPSGQYVVLSPAEVERRAIEANPLAVINVNTFFGGRDQVSYLDRGSVAFDRGAQYYVVTGQVVNRADSTLYGVQVIITIYGFGNVVYDTSTVNIGRLNPGDIRAFSVRFNTFPNIDDIYRYECIGTFQR